MAKYIIRRLIQAIPVLFGITIVVYGILLAAPGGPELRFANNPKVTVADREKFMKAWGLDQPIPIQYCRWMGFCNPNVDGYSLGMFISDSGVPAFLPAGHRWHHQRCHPRRLRHLHRDRRAGHGAHPAGAAADPHPGRRGTRHLADPGHPHRGHGGHQALQRLRPGGHGLRLRGLRHAHVLAGPDAHLCLCGAGP